MEFVVLKKNSDLKVVLNLNSISIVKVYDRKAVASITTVYNSKDIDIGKKHFQTKEPDTKILICNKCMRFVDANEQLLKYSNLSKRTIKWWQKVFPRMLNICLVSSFILCLDKFAMDMFFGYFLREEKIKKR